MGSRRTPSGVDTGKPPKSCGSRIDPTRTTTLHSIPTRSNPVSRLLMNSVLPTPGKPVMCIGIRACNPIAMSCAKCRNSTAGLPRDLRHRLSRDGEELGVFPSVGATVRGERVLRVPRCAMAAARRRTTTRTSPWLPPFGHRISNDRSPSVYLALFTSVWPCPGRQSRKPRNILVPAGCVRICANKVVASVRVSTLLLNIRLVSSCKISSAPLFAA